MNSPPATAELVDVADWEARDSGNGESFASTSFRDRLGRLLDLSVAWLLAPLPLLFSVADNPLLTAVDGFEPADALEGAGSFRSSLGVSTGSALRL